MTAAIKRMLAERAQAAQAHGDAFRRALWTQIGRPREQAFKFGVRLMRAHLKRQPLDPISAALAEGMESGMMDGLLDTPELAWRFSDTRKAALAEIRERLGQDDPDE